MINEDISLIWVNLRHAHELLATSLGHALEAEAGVGLSETFVLFRLANAPAGCLRMGDLAGRLDMAQSGMTRLIDRLEERGWVVREQPRDNRRTTNARLTEAGLAAYREVRPVYERFIRERVGASLSGPDLKELRRLLRQLLEGLGACEDAMCPPEDSESEAAEPVAVPTAAVARDALIPGLSGAATGG